MPCCHAFAAAAAMLIRHFFQFRHAADAMLYAATYMLICYHIADATALFQPLCHDNITSLIDAFSLRQILLISLRHAMMLISPLPYVYYFDAAIFIRCCRSFRLPIFFFRFSALLCRLITLLLPRCYAIISRASRYVDDFLRRFSLPSFMLKRFHCRYAAALLLLLLMNAADLCCLITLYATPLLHAATPLYAAIRLQRYERAAVLFTPPVC